MTHTEPVSASNTVSIRSVGDFMNQFLPEAARKEKAEGQSKVDINARKIADAVLAVIAPPGQPH
ncbi:MAG: hypothetical protein ACWGIK_25035 [Achromobacter pulmonis]